MKRESSEDIPYLHEEDIRTESVIYGFPDMRTLDKRKRKTIQ